MRTFSKDWTKVGIVKWLEHQSRKGSLHILHNENYKAAYVESCKAYHQGTGDYVILTRDTGHHTSGWWKNPDYERCIHLSLSFFDPETRERREHDHKAAAEWVDQVFHDNKRLVWTEPPYSESGKRNDVWHYRVFYADPDFTVPILPRGEVYTKEFTDAGWLSWSDVQAKREKEAEELISKITP